MTYVEESAFLDDEERCTCGHSEWLHDRSDEYGMDGCMLACCCTLYEDANPPPPPPPRPRTPGDEKRFALSELMTTTMDAMLPAMVEAAHKQIAFLEYFQRGQPTPPPVVHEKTGVYCLAHYETHSTGQCIKCRCGEWVRPQNWDAHIKEE